MLVHSTVQETGPGPSAPGQQCQVWGGWQQIQANHQPA